MSEATSAIVETPAISRADAQAAAAAVADTEEPVTTPEDNAPAAALTPEDVAGTKPAEGEPDRKLVAPSIREFLRTQATQVETPQTPLEREIADLREALDGLAAKGESAPPTVEEQTLAKIEALEARDAARSEADAEAAAVAEYDLRVATLKTGVIENINAKKEDYPGLVALEQQETVFNALVSRSQEGLETSEDEIASEVETGLRTVYKTLHEVYGTESTTPSEEKSAVSEPKVTLNPALSSTTEAADLDKMSRAERIEYLWERANPTP